MIIGVGPHTRRIYVPSVKALQQKYPVQIKLAIDLKKEASTVRDYFTQNMPETELLFVDPFKEQLPPALATQLYQYVVNNKINGVIIATEPTVHKPYASWALQAGLHILMDKPVTARDHVVTDPIAADGILDDYLQLMQEYQSLQRQKNTAFIVNVQRRYHPGFQQVRSLLEEITTQTNCPVTSIQSYHCDGQWRLPSEIVTQHYHPYNSGYGKVSHSGYHIFDIVHQFYATSEQTGKFADEMQVMSSFVQPNGFLAQLEESDYLRYFGDDYDKVKLFSDEQLQPIFQNFGEMDAAVIIRMLKAKENIANITINLQHNGFARRNWILPGKDLYKGNGRVKHEYHNIQQGPFQNIQIHSYQAKDKHEKSTEEDYMIGGNNHFDIHVFRNIGITGGKQALEVITMQDIAERNQLQQAALVVEQAKKTVTEEFLQCIAGLRQPYQVKSSIESHLMPVKMMSAVYASHIQGKQGNPVVTHSYECGQSQTQIIADYSIAG